MDLDRLLELNNNYHNSHNKVVDLLQSILDKGELIYKPDNLLFTSVFTNDSLLYDKIRVFKKIYNKYFQTHLYSFSLKFIVPFDYYFTAKSISEIDLESKKFFSYKNFYKEYTLEKQIIRDIYSNLIFLKKTSAKNIKDESIKQTDISLSTAVPVLACLSAVSGWMILRNSM